MTGGTPSRRRSDFWGGNIPWMSSGEIHQRRVTDTRETITDAGFAASNARWIPAGAVMVALNGQGKTRGMAAILERRMTCNQSLAAILSPQSALVADYLFHYLSAKYASIRRLTGDGGRNGLNLRHIRSIGIAYPPLPEQRKIAAVLSSVDDAIEKTQAVIDQVQVVKRGLMQELLTRGLPGRHTRFKQTKIGTIPEDWEFLQLADLAEPENGIQTGPFGSQLHASEYV
ncbi:MAG: restriction endonuclease subunit S, partial [Gemmatimonadetes bacterium]|nr:restriction endonuclease subunit S [Gemmatimonadota bacterium]